MNAIQLATAPLRLLNQPAIKEGIKNVAGCVTFGFGVAALYDGYQILRGRRRISSENPNPGTPQLAQVSYRIALLYAKVSLVFSAAVSRPGVFLISSLAGALFTSQQLEKAFGVNTIYALNPNHPRHKFSFVATLLALPLLVQTLYTAGRAIFHATKVPQRSPSAPLHTPWLTDAKVRMINLFNFATSRPVLHIGNQLVHSTLKAG